MTIISQRRRGTRRRTGAFMPAWAVSGHPGTLGRLTRVERAVPRPGPGEVLVRVRTCGVCRTDLHLADAELEPRAPYRVPGHEVIGDVVDRGSVADRFDIGERVGVAWLRSTCGACRWCRSGRENLCPRSEYTGWDHDGGFAAYTVAPEAFVYRIPDSFGDEEAAPLLCSGIIGYRALRRANLPPGGTLGIYGFGASAHLTLQVARSQGAEVHVMTRDDNDRRLALDLGAASASGAADAPPTALDAAILFAPVGHLVTPALAALDDAGTLAVAGIHLTDIPVLDYRRHLFRERVLTSVTSNTRADGEEFLRIAAALRLRPHVAAYPFDEADRALDDVAAGRISGAAVLA